MLEQPVVLEDKPAYDYIKRVVDVVCSVAGLAVLSPVLLAVTVVIVANDPGNPFFIQTRIGKDGKEFQIYKFRSMYKDAEKKLALLQKQNECKGATFKMKDDPRITKVGKFIRKTSIDELPQLLNILKGDMSIIGPRPFIPSEQENLPMDRLLVKPGLSCYWQIGGKNELELTEQIALDRKYIRERSLWTDFKIFCKTIIHVLSRKNC
ncbi:MAG: sugar transferase [Oscillospiraceae bacterium]|nr:sugar transferase [Oscillospiraceae bacterium]